MNESLFVEAAGRIEGLTRAVMRLTAALEEAGVIDGPRFAEGLRHTLRPNDQSPPHLPAALRTLQEIADALDELLTRSWG